MRILYIAPLPPPITGHSIAAQVLLEHLRAGHAVEVVNLSEGSQHDGTVTLKRIFVVMAVICRAFVAARRADRVYLTISESIAGNAKDLLIFVVIGRLLSSTVIHLHGGSFGQQILKRSPWLRRINQYFLSRVGAAIVCGPSHQKIFGRTIPMERIRTIPNFAQDFMFADRGIIDKKFSQGQEKIRVLFLSGMTLGKGYQTLLEAYERMSDPAKARIQLDFAGKFDDLAQEQRFLVRIGALPGVKYHGVVSGDAKANLFAQAHVFVLPTSFMEGQPISILEAYAAGCVVLTTPRPGILDIFEPSKNGFLISSEDSALLREILESFCQDISSLQGIALHNHSFAQKNYREKVFSERVESVLDLVHC